jgi:hypothetical protein
MRAFAFRFELHKLVAVDRPHHAHPGTVRFDQDRYFLTAPMHPADHIVLEEMKESQSLELNFFPAGHRQ